MNALDRCTYYLRSVLPGMFTEAECDALSQLGAIASFTIHDGAEVRRYTFGFEDRVLRPCAETAVARCGFVMSATTFLDVVGARVSPALQLMTRRIGIEGDTLLALRLARILEPAFVRAPFRAAASGVLPEESPSPGDALSAEQRRLLALHFHPRYGAPYWIERAGELGIRAEHLESLRDLDPFGDFEREALRSRSFRDFVPRSLVGRRLFIGETGGATGAPALSVWSEEDFRAAFVEPLLEWLRHHGLSDLRLWLFSGPTGPHPIGRAATMVARESCGIEPLRVDFDPRWHRRLPNGSTAARRHLAHLVEQTMHLLRRERPDALFTTPTLLRELLEEYGLDVAAGLRFIHLGGQSLAADEDEALRAALPPTVTVLNGYGNSLFGCVLEDLAAGPLRYRFPSGRHVVRLRSASAPERDCSIGEWGQLTVHRFDESMLLLNVLERDEALHCGSHFAEPRPIAALRETVAGGVY